MQYVLDCVTMLLNAVLCFFLLYGKYPVRTNQISKRLLLITAALIAKEIIIYLQIPPLNFISGCIIIVLMIRLLFNCNTTSLFTYSAMFAMLTLSADALGVIAVSAFHQNTISVTLGATTLVWQHHIWNWLIQIVLIRIAGLLIRKKERFKIQWHEKRRISMNKKLCRTLAGVMSLMFVGQVMVFGDGASQGILHADTIASAAEAIQGAKNADQLAKEFDEATKGLGEVEYFGSSDEGIMLMNDTDDENTVAENDASSEIHMMSLDMEDIDIGAVNTLTVTGFVKKGVVSEYILSPCKGV